MTTATPTFWIDVGGTFTDCLHPTEDGLARCKVLSSGNVPGSIDERLDARTVLDRFRRNDPAGLWDGYSLTWVDEQGRELAEARVEQSGGGRLTAAAEIPPDASGYIMSGGEEAPILAIRMLLQLPRSAPLPRVAVRLGTTRGTNALLTRRGARCGLVTTRGFADLLRIGNQDRPRLFELTIVKPEPLTDAVIEADERVDAEGRVLRPLDAAALLPSLQNLRDEGVESLAVCLLHALKHPAHELEVRRLAEQAGFQEIRLSHELASANRIVPRTQTTVLDAYLDPVLRRYVHGLREALGDSELLMMTSSGSLVPADQFSGKDSILSGPAGGVVGCAEAAAAAGFQQAIGFDMGGTSTDVSRYGGEFPRQYESLKAGVQIVTPSLAIETVAAGGGSICHFDGVRLTVGPDSAGSHPGPACYGRGGPLTLTDVNFFLGRIPDPALTAAHFPDLSFPIPLDVAPVERRLDELIEAVAATAGRRYARRELCANLLAIANANMARAAKSISVDRGYDPAGHLLVAFGGAAAQHACAVAELLGVADILIHPAAGLLSAYGIGKSQLGVHHSRPLALPADAAATAELEAALENLERQGRHELTAQGVPDDKIEVRRRADVCYRGIDAAITLELPDDRDLAGLYRRRHQQLYGFVQERPIDIVAARVEVKASHAAAEPSCRTADGPSPAAPVGAAPLYDGERRLEAGLHHRDTLQAGGVVTGPAVVLDHGATTVVDPGWLAEKLSGGDLLLSRAASDRSPDAAAATAEAPSAVPAAVSSSDPADPAVLELFNNQFSGIAEQMGIMLRNTSSSVNVKERLDFSCAVFTPAGRLVVNAPHIPVHLGAMSQTVRCVIEDTPDLAPGDVIVTNDPYRGGSHLPDITVVLPVFEERDDSTPPEAPRRLLFFTASRAHHADIGGLTPGSMPPFSTCLKDEGVLIRNFKLIDRGQPRFDQLRKILEDAPLPARKPAENMADLAAQVAACRQGAEELLQICNQHGVDVVLAYMTHMQEAAAFKVSQRLRQLGDLDTRRVDQLDNGARIAIALQVRDGRAKIDFAGTDDVLPSNLNANPAIVAAAAMYCMRCLIDEDIPLNEGVLEPLSIHLPVCLLNPPAKPDPGDAAAMVGGNVETSQRVVDILLATLGAAAASQGTMNNLTFGDESFGYYETICGGAGGTADGPGADAVHTHMTNTRLTDPEVLETRHPVRLREFSIRRDSHGLGRHRGGDGVVRVLEFLRPLTVSLLTQRRTTAPFGLAGGGDAQPGANWLLRSGSEAFEPLDGCCQFEAQAGDVLKLETPGGGGFGRASSTS